MNLIKSIIEPKRLLLCWQAPEGVDRSRFIVAELLNDEGRYSFRYLHNSADFLKAKELGFRMYPAFRDIAKVYGEGILEAFKERVPPPKRNDFSAYLNNYRIAVDAKISLFSLLGYSGARLPSDGFSIVNPLEDLSLPCQVLLELVGTRYRKELDIDLISVGQNVRFVPEPTNAYDPNAVMVLAGDQKIGYINRAQAKSIGSFIESDDIEINATIERINGSSERRIIYLFATISSRKE